MAKFGKTCYEDGLKFDSEAEREFYIKLKEFKKSGKIKDFVNQPNFLLQDAFETEYPSILNNYKIQKISITPDYKIELNDGLEILVDCKGGNSIEPDSQLRRKMFLYQNKTIPLVFIGKAPIYLGDTWLEVSQGADFLGKLKTKYNSLNPTAKGSRSKPVRWTTSDWQKYFNFHEIGNGLFYVWDSTKKKV